MNQELPGQLPLFTVEGLEPELHDLIEDEVCDQCSGPYLCWYDPAADPEQLP